MATLVCPHAADSPDRPSTPAPIRCETQHTSLDTEQIADAGRLRFNVTWVAQGHFHGLAGGLPLVVRKKSGYM